MLKDTLEETMEKSMKLENLERISMLFPDIRKQKKDDSFENELLMLQKVSDFSKTNEENNTETADNVIKLPFFKSIQYKLSQQLCV